MQNQIFISRPLKFQFMINACFSSPCRQVVVDQSGMPVKFNITSGYISMTITGEDDVNLAVVSNFHADTFHFIKLVILQSSTESKSF